MSNAHFFRVLVLGGVVAASVGDARPAEAQAASSPQAPAVGESAGMPVYIAPEPIHGEPADLRRHNVPADVRGSGATLAAPVALAPDSVGCTISAQPTLYWYLGAPTGERLMFTFNDPNRSEPLVQADLRNEGAAGIHAIALPQYGVRLQPGVEYDWSVALVRDPDNRSKDIVASAYVRRVPPAADLQSRLAAAGAARSAHVYAHDGLWYDALMVLSKRIDTPPGSPDARVQRAALFEQIGLPEIAAAERSVTAK